MEKEQLIQVVTELFPSLEINTTTNPIRIKTDPGFIHTLAETLRYDKKLQFDYLFNLYGIDREDRFSLVYYLESTVFGHIVSVETDLADLLDYCTKQHDFR